MGKGNDRGLFFRDGKWGIQYFARGKRVREIVGPSKTMARAALAKRKAQIAEGRYFPDRERRRRVTVEAWIDQRLAVTRHTRKDQRKREIHGRWWKAKLGSRTLDSITPDDVEQAIESIRATRSPATANRYLAFLKRIFYEALANKLVDENPVCRVTFAKETARHVRWLDDQEEQAIAERRGQEITDQDFDGILLAINTGLRQAEQWRLRASDIQRGRQASYALVRESKSGESRAVPLNATALGAIERLLRRKPGDDRIMVGDPTSTAKRFQRACKAAGLGHVRWHDLRHTFASRLVMRGVPIKTVQELLGHQTITMTMRYAHLAQTHLALAVSVLDAPNETATKLPHPVAGGEGGEQGVPAVAREKLDKSGE